MYFKVVASAQPLHHVGAHHSLAIRMAPSTDHGQCALGHIRRGMFCLSARQSVLRSVCDRSWWGGWKFVSACVTTLSEQPSSRVCLASLGIARLAGMACCGRSRAVANASTSPSAAFRRCKVSSNHHRLTESQQLMHAAKHNPKSWPNPSTATPTMAVWLHKLPPQVCTSSSCAQLGLTC